MVAQFNETLKIGKMAEARAEQYFKKLNIKYQDVRNNPEYQAIDVDYLTDKLGKVEVKANCDLAIKGIQDIFFWIELEVGDKVGWWYFTECDNFLFFGGKHSVLVKNDDKFKAFVNDAIETGDHSAMGNHRFDYKPDGRSNKIITAKNMRVYLFDLVKNNLDFTRLVKRSSVTK